MAKKPEQFRRHARGFESAAGLLKQRIRAAGETRGFAVSRLLTHWPEVVGADIAAMALPVKIGYGRDGLGATLTLLTKNSFLDEIRKQYVQTARAKGLTERQVLYGHVFRNAMLIVIAGFPGAFIAAFFSGSLLIETIFSLDGIGLLGYKSIIDRDYPVVFATLFIFSLLGLFVSLMSDLLYTWIDPRIDFESRGV